MNKTISEHYKDLYNVDHLRSCLDDYSAPQAEGLNAGEMGSQGRLMGIQGATPIRKRAKHREVKRAWKKVDGYAARLAGLSSWLPKDGLFPDYTGPLAVIPGGTGPKNCECGKDKHGFAAHSSWCPLHGT